MKTGYGWKLSLSKHTIYRSNGPPLIFKGEQLAHVIPYNADTGELARGWTELEAYRTEGGTIVIVVAKRGRSGHDCSFAFIADSWHSVKKALDNGEMDGVYLKWSTFMVELIRKASEKAPEALEILAETLA